jgi:hypothetical protein
MKYPMDLTESKWKIHEVDQDVASLQYTTSITASSEFDTESHTVAMTMQADQHGTIDRSSDLSSIYIYIYISSQ